MNYIYIHGRVLSPKSWFFSIGTPDRIYCRSKQRRNCFLGPKDPPIYGRPFNVCQRNRHCPKIQLCMCEGIGFGANRKKKIRKKTSHSYSIDTSKIQSNFMIKYVRGGRGGCWTNRHFFGLF